MSEQIIVKKPPKSPFLAGFLSFFFPGAGAIYNSEYVKGSIYILIFAGLVSILSNGKGAPFFGILMGGFYIFQIIDSVNVARAINLKTATGEAVEQKTIAEQLPKIAGSGSIFWGVLLLALGVFFLLVNFNIIDFHRLFDYWPLIIIAAGVKLVMDSIARKKKD